MAVSRQRNPNRSKSKSVQSDADGQEERFLKALDDYGDTMFRHATLRIADRERAIDLVHDTYAKVWTYIRGGYTVKNFRPFLYKVLNNLIVDEYRQQEELSLDAILADKEKNEGVFEELRDNSVQKLLNSLDGKRAMAVVSELPDIYREVIIFRFVDGLKPAEISDLIEETKNTVSVRIHRGLKLLRKIIAEQIDIQEMKRQKQKKVNPSP